MLYLKMCVLATLRIIVVHQRLNGLHPNIHLSMSKFNVNPRRLKPWRLSTYLKTTLDFAGHVGTYHVFAIAEHRV
jgi:hypothetical protein